MEIPIRRCQAEDASLIASSWLEAYTESDRTTGEALRPDAPARLEEWVRYRIRDRNGIVFIAELEGTFAGFILGHTGIRDSIPSILRPKKFAGIDALFVRDRFRRQGVATALVERVLARARDGGITGVEVTFEDRNRAAAALWRKLDFADSITHAWRSLQ